jgi:Asp-tRNA(Asn)/Glu-tRNA(Gln) amidotransferase A subunit family amidase
VPRGGQRQSEIYDPATNTWSLDATTLGESNGSGAGCRCQDVG